MFREREKSFEAPTRVAHDSIRRRRRPTLRWEKAFRVLHLKQTAGAL